MVAINGVLDPLSGETVAAAIHSLSGPTGEPDERSPGRACQIFCVRGVA
jgi:hypothetical protein